MSLPLSLPSSLSPLSLSLSDTYEVIEDPVSPADYCSDSFIKFTRPSDPRGLLKDPKPAGAPVKIPSMLKRGAITENQAHVSPPLSPGSRKPMPPPPPSKPVKQTEGFNIGELQKTLEKRGSSMSPVSNGSNEWNGPTEEYEEVQFSADVSYREGERERGRGREGGWVGEREGGRERFMYCAMHNKEV